MEPTTITGIGSAVMSVVIVDRFPLMRARLKALLRTEVPQADVVGEADDAQAAIRLIEAACPDVVILDLQLAGGSGFDVLRVIKLAPHPPTIIMLTNLTLPEYQVACLEAGAEFFLDKSFGMDVLTDILGHLARRRRCDTLEGEKP
jgi:DNA-binding NarL/FixJ family response regulator